MTHHAYTFMCVCMQDRDTVVMPRKPDAQFDSKMAVLRILRVIEFSSQTLRSGVVVRSDDAAAGTALLFLRGAPGVIKNLVVPSSLPADFDKVGLTLKLVAFEPVTQTFFLFIITVLCSQKFESASHVTPPA